MSDKFWKLLQKIHDRMEACPNGLVKPRPKDCDPNRCAVYKYAHSAGRASALREAVEAVENVYKKIMESSARHGPCMALDKAIAAIRALEEK